MFSTLIARSCAVDGFEGSVGFNYLVNYSEFNLALLIKVYQFNYRSRSLASSYYKSITTEINRAIIAKCDLGGTEEPKKRKKYSIHHENCRIKL